MRFEELATLPDITIQRMSWYGLAVDAAVHERDVEDFTFFYGDARRDAGEKASITVAFLAGDLPFWASLLDKDREPKRIVMQEHGHTVVDQRFTAWSQVPAVLPPYASQAFRQSYVLTPGSTVVSNEKCFLLRGENHVGKTTLVTELIERGAQVVSDHVCVVDRATGMVKAEEHLLVSLRRETLRRHADRLSRCRTRETVSEVTGRVVMTSLAELYGDAALIRRDQRLDAVVTLVPPGGKPEPLQTFPAVARESLTWLPTREQLVEVRGLEHLGSIADKMVSGSIEGGGSAR